MYLVNVHEAKSQLSKLIEKTTKGEEVVIGKAGVPVVRLVAYTQKDGQREFGLWKGKVFIPENFDEENKEVVKLFYSADEK